MKNKIWFALSLTLAATVSFAQALTKDEAVETLVFNYPEVQLADIYKSFYQDAFGPGHVLADSLASRRYFFSELEEGGEWGGPLFEFTGEGNNFVRLNMDLVRKGIIPAETYFQAFVNSLGRVLPPSPEEWINQWTQIDSILKAKNFSFPDEEADRIMIDQKLKNHNFTVHHSERFDSIYNFHYRIISIPEFERLKKIIKFEVGDFISGNLMVPYK